MLHSLMQEKRRLYIEPCKSIDTLLLHYKHNLWFILGGFYVTDQLKVAHDMK